MVRHWPHFQLYHDIGHHHHAIVCLFLCLVPFCNWNTEINMLSTTPLIDLKIKPSIKYIFENLPSSDFTTITSLLL